MNHRVSFYIVVTISLFMALFYPISSLLIGGSGQFGQLGGPFIFIGILAAATAKSMKEQANRIAKLEKRLAELDKYGSESATQK